METYIFGAGLCALQLLRGWIIGSGRPAKTMERPWSAGCSTPAEQIARENRMLLSFRRSCFGMLAGTMPLVAAACAPPSHEIRNIELDLQRFVTATNDAIACRTTAAQNPRYRILAERMPLNDIGLASLPQMTDPSLATPAQILALDSWSRDLNACREPLLQVTYNTLPSFGPIIEAARDEDDATLVQLTEQKVTWGKAVMQLKRNRTTLRANLTARADQVLAELGKQEEEQRNRRATVLSSIIRTLP